MPRPRAVARREPCDCLDCREGLPLPAALAALQAGPTGVARLDPPPRSLLVVVDHAICCSNEGGSSVAELSVNQVDCQHLDNLAAEGWTGRLALQQGSGSLGEQLLGVSHVAGSSRGTNSLPERFMGLHAALWADSAAAAAAGLAAGCEPAVQLASWPSPVSAAHQICKLLGLAPTRVSPPEPAAGVLAALSTPAAAGEAGPDMLVLLLDALSHNAAPGSTGSSSSTRAAPGDTAASHGAQDRTAADGDAACRALDWLDELVKELNQVPGLRQAVLLTVVLGCGTQALPQALTLQTGQGLAGLADEGVEEFAGVQRPVQSFQFAAGGGSHVEVDVARPAVVVHRLPSVVRRDSVGRLDLWQIARRGGAGCVQAAHVLPELAFKLGRAPKYGA